MLFYLSLKMYTYNKIDFRGFFCYFILNSSLTLKIKMNSWTWLSQKNENLCPRAFFVIENLNVVFKESQENGQN